MIALFSRCASRPLLAGFLVFWTLGAVGCGEGKGDLSGKVSYQGSPLAIGSVLFIGADGKPRTTWIQKDGNYRFDDVPVGEAKLAVYSPDPAKQDKLRKKNAKLKKLFPQDKPILPELPAVDPTKWFAIPAKYGDVDHSGLRVTIQSGPNTYHIEMK